MNFELQIWKMLPQNSRLNFMSCKLYVDEKSLDPKNCKKKLEIKKINHSIFKFIIFYKTEYVMPLGKIMRNNGKWNNNSLKTLMNCTKCVCMLLCYFPTQ